MTVQALSALPSQSQYERSLMHRDMITHVVSSRTTDFLVSASADGIIKFWKITPTKLEFVKLFRAHVGAVTAVALSPDG